jgi:hypothetical protein
VGGGERVMSLRMSKRKNNEWVVVVIVAWKTEMKMKGKSLV